MSSSLTRKNFAYTVGPIRARVKLGMLELLGKVDLPEGTEVSVTIYEPPSQQDREAFLSSAGAWKDTLDAEALIKGIYDQRLVSMRSEPRL